MSAGVVAGVEPLIGEARDRQRARRRRNALMLVLLAVAAAVAYAAAQGSPGQGGTPACGSRLCGTAAARNESAAAAKTPIVVARQRSVGGADPASSVLIFQSTFLSPHDGHIAPSAARKLNALVAAARRAGLPLKVAVIVRADDLASVPELFDRPQQYAYFLSSEDVYYWQNELIVVMPTGYGIYETALHDGVPANATPAVDKAALQRLTFSPTSNGTALVVTAQRAVTKLAALHHITLRRS